MNRNLRLKIEESIETKQISENLIYFCVAALQDKITNSTQQQKELIEQRSILAKAALNYGISKSIFIDKILSISDICYPTFKQISRVVNVLDGNFQFVSGFIPDKMIRYKSEEEIQREKEKPVLRKIDFADDEKEDFEKLIKYIEDDVLYYTYNKCVLSKSQINKLQELKKNLKTSYKIIFETFQFCRIDIEKGLSRNSFKNETHKFNYILKIVSENINTVITRIKNAEKAKKEIESLDMDIITHESANYVKKTEKTSDRLNNLW